MPKRFLTSVGILLLVLMTFSLSGCGSSPSNTPSAPNTPTPPYSPGSPSPGAGVSLDDYVVITIGQTGQLGRLFGGLTPTQNNHAADGLYDVIFRADPVTKEYFSYVLDDWYWEDDTTFIMKMHDGVYFSNGKKATAEDLVYAYTSYNERGSTSLNTWGIRWDDCHARDELTAVMKLDTFFSGFMDWEVYLHDKEWCQEVGWESSEWSNPPSSGPYTCAEFVPDVRIVLKAREDYWDRERRGPTYVDEYRIVYYPDPAVMYMDLELGNIDMGTVTSTDYSRFLKSGGDGFNVVTKLLGTNTNFYFSTLNNPIWFNKKLREAIAIGVNWEEIGKMTYNDLYNKPKGVSPSASPGFIDVGWDTLEYNPEKAKQLLEEEGYNSNNPLALGMFTMDGVDWKSLAEALQFQLSNLGVTLSIQYGDTATAMDVWRNYPSPNCDLGFHWTRRGSAACDFRMSLYYAATKTQSYTYVDDENGVFQPLYTKLARDPDPAVRMEAAHEIQRLLRDELLVIPVNEMVECFGYRTDKFTSEQMTSYIAGASVYQISRLGLLSAWE